MITITEKMYLDFIKKTIATEGYEIADKANKIALEMNKITIRQYRRAAAMIVEMVLAQ